MSQEKRSRAGACRLCRIRKKRCIPTSPESIGPCKLCQSLSAPCSLVPNFQHNPPIEGLLSLPDTTQSIESASPSTQRYRDNHDPSHTSILPPKALLRDLINLYFRLIHNGPHTLFHEPTFHAEFESDNLPPYLLLAIASVSARFSTNEDFSRIDPRLRCKKYGEAAMRLLQQDLINPQLESIQSCILISQYLGGNGDVKGKHIYIGLARLYLQAIRLWEAPVNSNIIEREIRRRVCLTVVIADRWSAADMSTSSMISEEHAAQIPILDEVEFMSLQPGMDQDYIVSFQPSSHGMWAQMAKTIDVFHCISGVISSLASHKTTIAAQEKRISHLTQQLDKWVAELPSSLKYTPQNLAHFRAVGLGKTFLAMHIGHFHFRQLLYFPFLDPLQMQLQPSSNLPSHTPQPNHAYETYAQMCKINAKLVSDVAQRAFENRGCELVYYIIGHVLVVSSSVHLHTLLFSEGIVEANDARADLVSNFETLMRLKMYWPVIDVSVGRLRTFQNDCQSSMAESFMLDGWMWKFLLEHSAVLDSERWAMLDPHAVLNQSWSSTSAIGMGIALEEPSFGSLNALVSDTSVSNAALVDSALSWLLD